MPGHYVFAAPGVKEKGKCDRECLATTFYSGAIR